MSFGAHFAHTPYYAFINALVAVALLYLFFALLFARLPLAKPSRKFSDVSLICLILLCLFYFKGFGSVFYWAAGSFNYLWAWALILLWCLPYRLFWGEFFAKKCAVNLANSAQNSQNATTSSLRGDKVAEAIHENKATLAKMDCSLPNGSRNDGLIANLNQNSQKNSQISANLNPNSIQASQNSAPQKDRSILPTILMLFLGLIAGWCSELNIVLFALQACFIALALRFKVKLPAWYYAGVLGFLAGWLLLYFSPGHHNRAYGDLMRPSYTSLGELLAMPLSESFSRLASTLAGVRADVLVAVAGLFVYLWLKFAPQGRHKALFIALCVLCAITYIFKDARIAFLLIGIFASLFAALKLRANALNSALLLFVLAGLFVADFLMFAATIQIGIPERAKLPYTLLGCAQIIVVSLLLKAFLSVDFRQLIARALCLVCALCAAFVLSACLDMRLKWQQMLASIQAQRAAGRDEVIVDSGLFRSYYEGYGDWGNPTHKHDEWPNTTYAEVFGVKKFIVRDFKNAKSAK